ncbi:MAG: hypothetical protein OEV08_14380 [Nitrospira sp.]|nr:hypothetical protein [Nitrospira sp.]
MERFDRIKRDVYQIDDDVLSDFFGALTMNQIGYGHSLAYYNKYPPRRQAEAFADMFEIYSRADRNSWNYIQQELPNLAARFEGVLRRFTE